jgi:hypothetical protein
MTVIAGLLHTLIFRWRIRYGLRVNLFKIAHCAKQRRGGSRGLPLTKFGVGWDDLPVNREPESMRTSRQDDCAFDEVSQIVRVRYMSKKGGAIRRPPLAYQARNVLPPVCEAFPQHEGFRFS